MLATIKYSDKGRLVVAAKLMTGYTTEKKKVSNADIYIQANEDFDSGFAAYVMAWQEKHHLYPTGEISVYEWREIAKGMPTCSTIRNRKGGYTFALQIMLGGFTKVDGVYGKDTKSAVVAFQKSMGLTADGICGPKTWSALIVGNESNNTTQKSEIIQVKNETIEWGTDPAQPTHEPYVVVTKSKAKIYDAPGGKNGIGVAKKGDKLVYDLVADVGGADWYRVEYRGTDGWIEKKYIKVV